MTDPVVARIRPTVTVQGDGGGEREAEVYVEVHLSDLDEPWQGILENAYAEAAPDTERVCFRLPRWMKLRMESMVLDPDCEYDTYTAIVEDALEALLGGKHAD